MSLDKEIKNAINAADINARYDESAKRLLGNKFILAHILVNTIDEFRGMAPKDVVSYIGGEPFIGVIPVEPGLTGAEKQKKGQRIIGLNTESGEIREGFIRFDIIFYVRMKDGVSQVIVNVEAQKDEPAGYHILNRAVFYVSRLISSQKERDFVGTNYNDIKRVFSIWICMNMKENSMDYVHLTNDKLLGAYQWKGRLDLLNIVLIGISNKLPEHDDKYEMHRLLSVLLSDELSATEKLGIIDTEYSVPVDDDLRKDVNVMCNLSQGILEKGEAIGLEKGEAIGWKKGEVTTKAKLIINMYKKGFATEQIADVAELQMEDVEAIIKGCECNVQS